ncbi:hypothetical protein BC830DRAFT_1174889 [Chytriomyces sp. MP71]|nr:hypothetical protein BC830DRAFT_1174889 [Chytriomyces sp. MP71]
MANPIEVISERLGSCQDSVIPQDAPQQQLYMKLSSQVQKIVAELRDRPQFAARHGFHIQDLADALGSYHELMMGHMVTRSTWNTSVDLTNKIGYGSWAVAGVGLVAAPFTGGASLAVISPALLVGGTPGTVVNGVLRWKFSAAWKEFKAAVDPIKRMERVVLPMLEEMFSAVRAMKTLHEGHAGVRRLVSTDASWPTALGEVQRVAGVDVPQRETTEEFQRVFEQVFSASTFLCRANEVCGLWLMSGK